MTARRWRGRAARAALPAATAPISWPTRWWCAAAGAGGLSVFGQFAANPRASAPITRWFAAGLVKTGTFASRDADTIALGIIQARVNPRLRDLHEASQAVPDGFVSLPAGETAIELSYGIQLRRWLSIRPDVQYILDPGTFAFRRTRNALAFGSQVKVQF